VDETISDTRYVFLGWSGGVQSPDPSVALTVDTPKTVTANWVRRFYVSATSQFSYFIGGNDWYDEGSRILISLRDTAFGLLVRDVFDHFEGLRSIDVLSPSGGVELYVDGPRTIVAVWRKDYTQLFVVVAGGSVILACGALLARRRRKKKEREPSQGPPPVPGEDEGTKVYAVSERSGAVRTHSENCERRSGSEVRHQVSDESSTPIMTARIQLPRSIHRRVQLSLFPQSSDRQLRRPCPRYNGE